MVKKLRANIWNGRRGPLFLPPGFSFGRVSSESRFNIEIRMSRLLLKMTGASS